MTSNKNESPNMNPNNQVSSPTPRVPIVAPIVSWVGSAIGGWILGEGLNALKGLIFPGSQPYTMEQILAEVEKLLNKRLTEERRKILEKEYVGFIQLADQLSAATKTIASHEKNESIEIEEARATARDIFVHFNLSLIQRLPQFEIEGYEGVSLPLFAQICTLHLTLLKDGILMGARWGLTSDDVKYYRNEFYRLTSDYTTRAGTLYSRGFATVGNRGDIKNRIEYKNTMNQYAMDLVYLWSLMRYEGITPSVSRSLWHFVGGTTQVSSHEWREQYKLMNGIVGGLLKSVTFHSYVRSGTRPYTPLYGVLPKYIKSETQTGWMGYSKTPINGYSDFRTYHSPDPDLDPPKSANINYSPLSSTWRIKIGDTEVIPPGVIPPPNNFISHDGYYIRTISAIPNAGFPANLNLNLGSKLELDMQPNLQEYSGNLILGFAPDNTKEFFKTALHVLPAKGSYTIPALQYNSMNDESPVYLEELLDQGTDGGLQIFGAAGSNSIRYQISMEGVDFNKKYVLLLRTFGHGTINVEINRAGFLPPNPYKIIGDFYNPNFYGWTDHVSNGFTFELDGSLDSNPTWLVLRKKNDSDMRISQIMIIPESEYKILIP
ncbi:insecticidal delta-endotoxin Cry8Ea1 family protein [Bacillus sp. FSL R12-0074]|uniref:insecticidal delta-endotoxin Cry8Ea1 family protein n=1 Tax=Bacillus sp. FSL R12-0074 TaxID=2954664 RepID=UPI0030F4FF2D